MASFSAEFSDKSSMDWPGQGGEVDSTNEATRQDSSNSVSLLEVLKLPVPAAGNRKRIVRANHLPSGRKRYMGATASDPKNIIPAQRAREFKDENLIVNHLL